MSWIAAGKNYGGALRLANSLEKDLLLTRLLLRAQTRVHSAATILNRIAADDF